MGSTLYNLSNIGFVTKYIYIFTFKNTSLHNTFNDFVYYLDNNLYSNDLFVINLYESSILLYLIFLIDL